MPPSVHPDQHGHVPHVKMPLVVNQLIENAAQCSISRSGLISIFMQTLLHQAELMVLYTHTIILTKASVE